MTGAELEPHVEDEAAVGMSWRKRLFDVAFALAALLFLAPTLLFITFAILVETGGPVLYRQQRTGYRGRPFDLYTFRTLRSVEEDSAGRQPLVGGSRLTKVGVALRALSLDELPQLLNVLRGDMSLIGPRPHALAHDTFFAAHLDNYPCRFLARPGLTGLAQVSGLQGQAMQIDGMRRLIEADCEYIRRWSFSLDLAILLRTIPLILSQQRA